MSSWREIAEYTREALDALGHIVPMCLPGEPEECGGGDFQHAAAHFATLRAVVDNRIRHLPPEATPIVEQVHGNIAAELATEECDQPKHTAGSGS